MIDYKDIQSLYFLGIGGIGMSALARYFKAQGFLVMGYDRTVSPLTKELEKEGIEVHYTDLVEHNELQVYYQIKKGHYNKDRKVVKIQNRRLHT